MHTLITMLLRSSLCLYMREHGHSTIVLILLVKTNSIYAIFHILHPPFFEKPSIPLCLLSTTQSTQQQQFMYEQFSLFRPLSENSVGSALSTAYSILLDFTLLATRCLTVRISTMMEVLGQPFIMMRIWARTSLSKRLTPPTITTHRIPPHKLHLTFQLMRT